MAQLSRYSGGLGSDRDTYRATSSDKDAEIPIDYSNPLSALVKIGGYPECCSKCGGRVEYVGLGKYECTNHDCRNVEYDNYGKVRSVLDINMNLNFNDVMAKTGLTRTELQNLIDRGSITLVKTGRGTLDY